MAGDTPGPRRGRTHQSAKQDARKADGAERRSRALGMRRAGATYRMIAAELGLSSTRAHQYVQDALLDIPAENKAALVALETERLDRDWRRVEKKLDALENVQTGAGIHAMCELLGQARKIQERRAKYFGLDAPVKAELTGRDGAPLQILGVDLASLSDEQLEALRATNDARSLGPAPALVASGAGGAGDGAPPEDPGEDPPVH